MPLFSYPEVDNYSYASFCVDVYTHVMRNSSMQLANVNIQNSLHCNFWRVSYPTQNMGYEYAFEITS